MTVLTDTRPRAFARPAPSRARLVVAAVLPLVLLAGWGMLAAAGGRTSGLQIGDPAPNLALADLDGQPVRLADLRGRPVIVNFWASWCGACVEEFPMLQSALDTHQDAGLAVVGIVVRDSSAAARAFMARMGATWPAAMDPGERTAAQFGIYAPPETFFIDARGVVAGRQIGQLSYDDLERQLSLILETE